MGCFVQHEVAYTLGIRSLHVACTVCLARGWKANCCGFNVTGRPGLLKRVAEKVKCESYYVHPDADWPFPSDHY